MKYRTGFVSNSSTQSFIVFGTKIDEKMAASLAKNNPSEWNLPEGIVMADEEYYIGVKFECGQNNDDFEGVENELDVVESVGNASIYIRKLIPWERRKVQMFLGNEET